MKHKITRRFQCLFARWQHQLINRVRPYRARRSSPSAGLTLIELLVAALITSIVILIAGNGLLSALNATQVAEAKTARRTELNRAFDFMTNEIRMAQSINRTNNLSVNSTVTVEDVVNDAGLTNSQLGSFGTIALYLDIPIDGIAPAICPTGGPNAGLAPPTPSDRDLVVYDIRPSSQGWLGPRSVNRYGRIPLSNGVINPCSSPVASDTLVDAISTAMSVTPNCPAPGLLTGAEGFRACVTGAQVDLLFQSNGAVTPHDGNTCLTARQHPPLLYNTERSQFR
jgi:Tfp pilus assembly protein PilW